MSHKAVYETPHLFSFCVIYHTVHFNMRLKAYLNELYEEKCSFIKVKSNSQVVTHIQFFPYLIGLLTSD